MVFRGFVRSPRRSLAVVVACVALAVGGTFAWDQSRPTEYESVARVIISSAPTGDDGTTGDAGTTGGSGPVAGAAASYAEVVGSELVASRVAARASDELGADFTIDELVGDVSTSAPGDGSVLELRVRNSDAALAQEVAQLYTEELVGVAAEIERGPDAQTSGVAITVLDFPSYPTDPVTPQQDRDLLVALGAGAVVGLLLAIGLGLADRTIRSRADLQRISTVPVIGTVGHESGSSRRRLISELDQQASRVEDFRVLRTNVQFLDGDAVHRVLAVTSSAAGDGKSTTAVDLAITLSRAGLKTLLVDGDLRRPSIASIFGIDGVVGLTTVILGKIGLAEATWRHDASGLDVLPSGVTPPNAADLLQTRTTASLIQSMRQTYDVVVIDTAPLLPVTDAALLAGRADATLLVVRHGMTRRDQLVRSLERLSQVDVVPAGLVLNDAPRSGGGYESYVSGAKKSASA